MRQPFHRLCVVFQSSLLSLRTLTRIRPITMKIDTPLFHGLFTPELLKLNELFRANNYQLRMAGGAVRDLLMEIKPADVDFASDATPTQMKEMFEKHSIRMFNKNGEEHGTVTCRIDDKENFEITTLRIDVVCDGRRAKVEFTTDWQRDANRRDLTVNSLFLELDGTVIDYFGGIEDVKKRRVVFVGDAETRIQEDYLRILRYFRFFGRITRAGSLHEKECIDAIIANKQGLSGISGERIWSELKKICVGRLADEVMATMLEECGLASYLGLPENAPIDEFRRLYNHNASQGLLPMTALSALFSGRTDLEVFHKKCKVSNAERTLSEFIIDMRDEAKNNNGSLRYFQNLMVDAERAPNREKKKIGGRELVTELAKYACASPETLTKLAVWEIPVFPVSGVDLMAAGAQGGPMMRETLTHLYNIWKSHEWTLSKEELLPHINEVKVAAENLQDRRGAKRRRKDTKE